MKRTDSAFKDELLFGLKAVRESILNEALALPAEARDRVFLGTWSVMDLLAHLAGWDFTNLQAVQDVLDGLLPEFYDHRDADWRAYNAILVGKYKRTDFSDQVQLVRDAQGQLLNFLQTLPAEDLKRDTGVRYKGIKVTIARLLQSELEDEETHFDQALAFRKSL
ncbi:MAG: ClbS/DfsB family four-helix bundle protein [Chloroflexota bacterium]